MVNIDQQIASLRAVMRSNLSSSRRQLLVTRDSRSPIAEQFRALRTNIDFFSGQAGQQNILFTSSMSGEGKSFVAVNLDLISSGPIPPNPAEIILHDRTEHLFSELRQRYDYVVICTGKEKEEMVLAFLIA